MDDGPSSLKTWKDKFFLIDRRAIPDYLTWRHSCSCILNDLPSDGYDWNDVQRLCARLIYLYEMREEVLVQISIYDFMTLPSWSDAKIVKEPHILSLLLLERVPSQTTAPTSEGAIISLPTPNEIAASLPDSHLVKKSKDPSQASQPSKRRKLQKRASQVAVTSVSDPSHVGTVAPASTSARSLSLEGVVAGSRVRKSKAQMGEVMRRQIDPLDCLAQALLLSLAQKLFSSDEFHAALARVASFGINYGVERGLHMGRSDVEFEAAVQK
nr:hypothetical protein [Tanacetum cinerariifolium]